MVYMVPKVNGVAPGQGSQMPPEEDGGQEWVLGSADALGRDGHLDGRESEFPQPVTGANHHFGRSTTTLAYRNSSDYHDDFQLHRPTLSARQFRTGDVCFLG